LRIPALLALLALAGLACGLGDIFSSPSTSAPPVQGPPTTVPSCKPATTAQEEADILFQAQVNEHAQPGISITILYQNSTQLIEFVKPDSFHWRTESGGVWEEVISVGGTVHVRSSATGWAVAPLLDPTVAALMQGFINPPVQQTETEMRNQLAQAGLTNLKFTGWLVGYVPDFFGTCVYALTIMSGGSPVYTQKTWIGPSDGLRYKFEARDGSGNVTEVRLWDYENITISAP
jgi:hypothetical protein